MRLLRAHGLGNDYLVLLSDGPAEAPSPEFVRMLCNRHTGVGSDGLLVEAPPDDGAEVGLRIFNPDGSEAEKSGNGLRIFARYQVDHRGMGKQFTVSTKGGLVPCVVAPEHVTAHMGIASFKPAEVPCLLDVDEVVDQPISSSGEDFTFTAVGIGNPHCVIFRDEALLDATRWRRWGPLLETHPLFPNRTNVQFVKVEGPRKIVIRIWERGAGATIASGSSSCAAAAAAVKTGRCDPGWIAVHMPGGTLDVVVSKDLALRLRGPVEEIGIVEVSEGWLSARRG
ncbi:MAG: diaminopimelate epimerase [Proteobacteria bacterium]|nr:diaminopimelate epimerase [Pseudomonadota bacterium]MCP4922379.1 diaminopimelate epimerase [Pseudomonadota bacterium]